MGNLVSFLEERLRNGVLDSKLVAGHLEVDLLRLGKDDVLNGMRRFHVLKYELWGTCPTFFISPCCLQQKITIWEFRIGL